ncbi:MAG: hypothetical protein HY521_00905 [Proteobacteria bacterium]|nr:hypothetical protein [Pseudomonadota bacterium]
MTRPRRGRRRVYKQATAEPAEGGFAVALDGRRVATPLNAPLVLPTRALAEAVAEEWRRQGETLDPGDMPLTRLAATAIDRVAPAPDETIAALMRFAETDLLCYRAREPASLSARQRALWQPLLDWADETLGARLAVTDGVLPVRQPAAALAALRAALARYPAMVLAALGHAVRASGSLVIGLALAEGRLDARAAASLAELEEEFQNERWGEDGEALARRRRVGEEVGEAARFLALARVPAGGRG